MDKIAAVYWQVKSDANASWFAFMRQDDQDPLMATLLGSPAGQVEAFCADRGITPLEYAILFPKQIQPHINNWGDSVTLLEVPTKFNMRVLAQRLCEPIELFHFDGVEIVKLLQRLGTGPDGWKRFQDLHVSEIGETVVTYRHLFTP